MGKNATVSGAAPGMSQWTCPRVASAPLTVAFFPHPNILSLPTIRGHQIAPLPELEDHSRTSWVSENHDGRDRQPECHRLRLNQACLALEYLYQGPWTQESVVVLAQSLECEQCPLRDYARLARGEEDSMIVNTSFPAHVRLRNAVSRKDICSNFMGFHIFCDSVPPPLPRLQALPQVGNLAMAVHTPLPRASGKKHRQESKLEFREDKLSELLRFERKGLLVKRNVLEKEEDNSE
ncbi:unnamed protein product [Cyprideis torosa]|uniref:Uncharacterized protein n=1 Tax=Cyprideis torosa TaxID=163714 RepID=A0A7R8ZT27_9CRUS|nr:unnamed protein product [Cyprideis torosa]CAG0903060.1 unnamed protein product [Cyprideis torosa]